MLPFVYGFTWDAFNIIFLGAFFIVISLIVVTLVRTTIRTMRAMTPRKIDEIRWHAGFDELPSAARVCRHAITGEAPNRRCENAFACDHCSEHPQFQQVRERTATNSVRPGNSPFFAPEDRLYHRGHTWVRQEPDGTVTIGLDDLGRRLFVNAESEILPSASTQIHRNGIGWHIQKGNRKFSVLAPVSGTVVAMGQSGDDWKLRVKPLEGESMEPLLRGEEVGVWLRGEFERFQRMLSLPSVGTTLADGGTPAEDLSTVIPEEQREHVYADMFLQN
jgi:glycine cleavage system H lipoate-binding protein